MEVMKGIRCCRNLEAGERTAVRAGGAQSQHTSVSQSGSRRDSAETRRLILRLCKGFRFLTGMLDKHGAQTMTKMQLRFYLP